MKKKILCTLILFISFYQNGFSQNKFTYWPEIGFSFSQFAQNKTKDIGNFWREGTITESTKPLYSPLLGISCQVTEKKHYQFTFGLQYQKCGSTYSYHSFQRYTNPPEYTSTYDASVQHTYNKFTIPITCGYTFKIGKIAPTLYVGIRPNIFIKGKYQDKYAWHNSNDSLDKTIEHGFNPFKVDEAPTPISQLDIQVLAGISVIIAEKIKISLGYYKGRDIYNMESLNYINRISYINQDFTASISYLLKPNIKK